MTIHTEIRIPRIRVRPAQTRCVRVYTREGEKPVAAPEPPPKPQAKRPLTWAQMARLEGHAPKLPESQRNQLPSVAQNIAAENRKRRIRQMLTALLDGPLTRQDLRAAIGLAKSSHSWALEKAMTDTGLAHVESSSRKAVLSITDAGRVWLAEQTGQQCL